MAFMKITTTPRFLCESGDVKPTQGIQLGSTAYEVDTYDMYHLTENGWELKPSGVLMYRTTVEEVLTEADAVSEVLTFSEDIQAVEIYHNEYEPQEFVVNGITLIVGWGGWRSPVGGIPSAEVTIPADVDCIVSRLV